VERATAFTGQGIITGALTTAAAFLAMALTHFKGIQEMGVISGGGLLLCLVPMLTTLAVMLMRGRQNRRDRRLGAGGQLRLQIEVFWLRHPIAVLVGAACACALAGWEARRVFFDYDLLHLQNPRLASVTYEKKLIQSAGASALYGAVVADTGPQANDYAARLRALPSVADVRSAADFIKGDQA